jgi:monovalent cation:H+ antiporter, CPA1 family
MSAYETLGALLTIAAAFAYLNHRFLRLPPAIGLMAMSLVLSLLLLAAGAAGLPVTRATSAWLDHVAFNETLLHGMLGALLFAGALHINVDDLRKEGPVVLALALGGTLISTALVGGAMFLVLPYLHLPIPFGYCLLFGSLISPTDPIAVLGILRQARIPKSVEMQIAGESMFNDGVGVVVFLTVLGAITQGNASLVSVSTLFLREAVGGAIFGVVTGWICFRLLRSIDHYQTELLITLALVLGGYALAERLHLSAPIAAVTSGLLVGNQGRKLGMSDVTRDHLDKFWMLVDEVLNAVLFVLIGLEMLRLKLSIPVVFAGLVACVIVLTARLISISVPALFLRSRMTSAPGAVWILTWGGLRGGISVALALSMPMGEARDVVVVITYVVVIFSVLVQGLTLGRLARRFRPADDEPPSPDDDDHDEHDDDERDGDESRANEAGVAGA